MKKHVLKRPNRSSRKFLIATFILILAAISGAFAAPANAQTAAFDV
jgi:hypothetical protein